MTDLVVRQWAESYTCRRASIPRGPEPSRTELSVSFMVALDENERAVKTIKKIRSAFESNKNFMWGHGIWSVISKTRKAIAEFYGEEDGV